MNSKQAKHVRKALRAKGVDVTEVVRLDRTQKNKGDSVVINPQRLDNLSGRAQYQLAKRAA